MNFILIHSCISMNCVSSIFILPEALSQVLVTQSTAPPPPEAPKMLSDDDGTWRFSRCNAAQSTERSEGDVVWGGGGRGGCIFFKLYFVPVFYACRNSAIVTTGVYKQTTLFQFEMFTGSHWNQNVCIFGIVDNLFFNMVVLRIVYFVLFISVIYLC